MKKKLNIGCGGDIRDDYVNADLSYEPCREDIREMTFEDETFDEVLASHILEHIHFSQLERAFLECFRVLKPNGKFVVEVPNSSGIMKAFLEAERDNNQGLQFLLLQEIFGDFGVVDAPNNHRYGFTRSSLPEWLEKTGFKSIVEEFPEWGGEGHKEKPRLLRMVAIKPGD